VQGKLLKELKKSGWFYNTNDRFRAGIPDILGSYKGRFCGIEVKIDSTPVTPLQLYELKRIRESEGLALVARYNNTTHEYTINEKLIKSENLKETVAWILKLHLSNIKKSVSS